MRHRTPPGLCLMRAQVTNTAEYCSPASAHLMSRTEHELVDCGTTIRALGFKTQKGHEGPKKRKSVPNGPCCYEGCPRDEPGYNGPLPKRPQLLCQSCKDGHGAFYHLGCFFKVHRCCVGA